MPELVSRQAVHDELEGTRAAFRRLVEGATPAELRRLTHGTRWTNEQLLFHMGFGYMVVQRLLGLVKVFSRLPDHVSRLFARGLNAATRPFDVINYYGSCAAALVYNRRRMGAKMDRVIAALQHRLTQERDESLHRSMHFPTRWDPFFSDYMSVEDVYSYPGQHFDFHARQLTLNSTHD